MTLDRVRTAAALVLLACLALPTYTCDGSDYVGPRGEIVSQIPDGADSAAYQRTREPHYAIEWMSEPPGIFVLLAFTWPVPFFIYRRCRAPAPIPRWVMWLSPVFAVLSGLVILRMATIGRPAIGAYLAWTADAVLFADGTAQAWTGGKGRAPVIG
jgi:hypothetical protein